MSQAGVGVAEYAPKMLLFINIFDRQNDLNGVSQAGSGRNREFGHIQPNG